MLDRMHGHVLARARRSAARLAIPLALAGALTGAAAGVVRADPWFVDATRSAGLAFTHHAARSSSWYLPETMGSGGALFDLDGDGDLDALLLDQGPPPGTPARDGMPRHGLFLNESTRAGLRFTERPAPALAGLTAMGACVGDIEGDGDADVYVTGLPAGRLLRNDGGRLAEAPGNAGIVDPGWGTSCLFFDSDRDGDLDLFVAHYVVWSAATEKRCGGERPGFFAYCPPDQYAPEQDLLFVNDGKGKFRDGTAAAGFTGERGKGLGVVAADFDGDGRTDLYVANDQVPSALWLAEDGGRYREVGLLSGTALSEEGRAQAGMGVDAGDADGDLDVDLTKTNFALETNNLYLLMSVRAGTPRYREGIRAAGLAEATLRPLGFGTILGDLDGDGDADLFVANGHLMPNIHVLHPEQTQAQRAQIFENLGARTPGAVPAFRDARERWRPASETTEIGRGLLAGDLDSDGDLDLVVTQNEGAARLLRNDSQPSRWIGLDLRATASAPGAPGASAILRGAGPDRLGLRRTGGSYLSACDERVLFGLAGAPKGPLSCEVRWPSGAREIFALEGENRYVVITEGTGRPASAASATAPPSGR